MRGSPRSGTLQGACSFAVALLVGGALLAGCGSDSDSSTSASTASTAAASTAASTTEGSSLIQEAQNQVDAVQQPVTFKDPGPAIDVGNTLKGKTVYAIMPGLNFPFVQAIVSGMKEAAAKLGAKVVALDSGGQVAKASELIDQAISQKASTIVVEAIPAEALRAPLQEAEKAGIPVIEMTARDPQAPPASAKAVGVDAIVSSCFSCGAKQMAQFITADSKGDADVALISVPGIAISPTMVAAFTSEYKRLCPGCELRVSESPQAQWASQLPSLTTSILRKDPNVNYLVPLFDAMALNMLPSVATAGKTDSVKLVSNNATQPVLVSLKKGDVVAADVGSPQAWIGWATLDQMARLLLKQDPVADENVPNRMFDAANIDTIDLNAPESTWYGEDADFRTGYLKLWGK